MNNVPKQQLFDDDIALLKTALLLREADLIEKLAEHEDCACHPLADHRHACPKGIWLRVARIIRMDAEG